MSGRWCHPWVVGRATLCVPSIAWSLLTSASLCVCPGLAPRLVLRRCAAALKVGIMSSLVMYGLMQERIVRHPYGGEDGQGAPEFFNSSLFLVFCNRVRASRACVCACVCRVTIGRLGWRVLCVAIFGCGAIRFRLGF